MTIDFNLTEDDIKEAVRRYVHQLAAPITIEGNIIVTLTHQQERQAGATYSALASVCAGRRGPAAPPPKPPSPPPVKLFKTGGP